MSSSDLQVVVDQMPADPVKPSPSKLPKWLQSNRNKALTGLGLLTLIAIPAIVAPVVVSQQKQQQQNALRSTDPASEQYARDAADQNEDPDDFVAVDSPRRPTTTFNATRYGGNTTRRGKTSRLKVPPRSWANANKTRASLTRPERWTPFVKIRDGQVRPAADWVPHARVVLAVTRTWDP
jgi:type II secretory pathway pseudopilin PulG